jgi:hypothetical protein
MKASPAAGTSIPLGGGRYPVKGQRQDGKVSREASRFQQGEGSEGGKTP